MKVYVINQTWNNSYDGMDNIIIGVYSSKDSAVKKLKELYKEDLEWIKEHAGSDPLEENEIAESSSFVKYDDRWSSNEIHEFEVL